MYARYTEYLRDLMLNEQTREALNNALSTYPLYSSQNEAIADLIPSRDKLNEKLLNHYKYREIGFETVGRFLDELEITMCEIMPRYNELFKTVEIMAELPSPFDNVDVVETFEQEATSTASNQSTDNRTNTTESENNGSSSATLGNKANSKQVKTDTPQNQIDISTKDIDEVNYASEMEWNEAISEGTEERQVNDTSSSESTSEGSASGSSESSGTVKHTLTKKGNQGVNTYAHDMNEFRTSIIDVVDQIINDSRINELFMLVY